MGAGTRIGGVFAELGFDVDDKPLLEFDRAVKSLSSDLLEVIGIGSISVATLGFMAKNALGSAQNMRSLAQSTNLAASELQKYASVANVLNPNISTEAAANSISDLDRRLNAFRAGYTNAINVRALNGAEIGSKNGLELIEALKVSYRGLSDAQIGTNLEQLGLPKEFLNLLRSTPDEFNKIASQVSLTNKQLYDLADASKALNAEFQKLGTIGTRNLANFLRYMHDPEFRNQAKKDADELTKKNNPGLYHLFNGNEKGDYKRNNPGNIRKWGDLPQDNGFAVFPSAEAGFEAMRKNLLIYQKRGWNSIDSIVDHWAPASDGNKNNKAYKEFLASRTGMGITQNLGLDDPLLLNKVVKGIADFEGSSKSGSRTYVTIHNKGEVSPELWRMHEQQNNQNTAINTNNGAAY